MKNLLSTLLALLPLAALHAQIPNPGFEEWIDLGAYKEPVGWQTNNATDLVDPPIQRLDEIVVAGNYSALVRSACSSFEFYWCPGFAKTTFAIGDTIPQQLYATGFCLTAFSTPGYCEIEVNLRAGGQLLSSTVTPIDTSVCSSPACYNNLVDLYRPLAVPVNPGGIAQADSMEIILRAIPIPAPDGTGGGAAYFYIDELSFSAPVTAVREPSALQLQIWPNPASDPLYGINHEADELQCRLFDIHGRFVANLGVVAPGAFELDISPWPAGLYMLEFTSPFNGRRWMEKIARQ